MTKSRSRCPEPKPDIADAVDAFRRILRELRVVARRTELATGLSAAQMFVLSAVDSRPWLLDQRSREVDDDRSQLGCDHRGSARRNGAHVIREASGDDRRRASIALTARGQRAVSTAESPAPTALLIQGLETLPPARLRELARGLAALTTGMGIADQRAEMLFEDAHREPRPRRGVTRLRERRASA